MPGPNIYTGIKRWATLLCITIMMKPGAHPVVGEITMVVPTEITELGVYVNLVEYGNLGGLIVSKDLSKKRFRSIKKIVRIGKKFPALVVSIDADKGYISLSKKEVAGEEAAQYENTYRTYKYVHDLVCSFANKLEKERGTTVGQQFIYNAFIWSLSTDPEQLIFLLKSASKDFDRIYEGKLDGADPDCIACFKDILAVKFKENDVVLEAVMEITCLEMAGVNTIKSVLAEAQDLATDEHPFAIKLVKSPFYSITIKTTDPKGARNLVEDAMEFIRKELEKKGARFKVAKMPEATSGKGFEYTNSDSGSD